MRPVGPERLWELSGLDRTLRIHVRSFPNSASDATCQREPLAATASLNGTSGGQAATGRIRSPPDASDAHDLRVRSSQKMPSEEVTAILAHGAKNRSGGRPLAIS